MCLLEAPGGAHITGLHGDPFNLQGDPQRYHQDEPKKAGSRMEQKKAGGSMRKQEGIGRSRIEQEGTGRSRREQDGA